MTHPNTPSEEAVRQALHDVLDPEVGIDIVELGLVYSIKVTGPDVVVEMTMTSPTCPLGEHLVGNAIDAIRASLPDVRSVDVQLVWMPPWGPSRMSAAARTQLGWDRGAP